MGRYYDGDIEGKFMFGRQSSDDADFFGQEGTPTHIDYYFQKENISTVKEKLLEYSLHSEVKGRPKHFYSIYKKMAARGVDFEQVQDLLAFR